MNSKLLLIEGYRIFFENNTYPCYLKKNTGKKIILSHLLKEHSMSPKKLNTEKWFSDYSNVQFFQLRMEKNTFDLLLSIIYRTDINDILSKKYTGGHYPIEIKDQLLIFLWYMATQDTLRSIGTRFNISPSSVMDIINKVLYIVIKLKKSYILFPSSEEYLKEISKGFTKYPGAVGALDGTHIFIKIENMQQDSYLSRYRRHSINIMAICDSNRLFTYVYVGFPGSAHDARVFDNSSLKLQIDHHGANYYFVNDEKYHLIGDSAFGVKKWLMTPFKENYRLNPRERHHNYCLSSSRVVIEHAFGTLKGRWRRTQFINTYNVCKTIEIATAACILHNFCIHNADLWNEQFIEERLENMPINEREDYTDGLLKRNRISRILFNRVHLNGIG